MILHHILMSRQWACRSSNALKLTNAISKVSIHTSASQSLASKEWDKASPSADKTNNSSSNDAKQKNLARKKKLGNHNKFLEINPRSNPNTANSLSSAQTPELSEPSAKKVEPTPILSSEAMDTMKKVAKLANPANPEKAYAALENPIKRLEERYSSRKEPVKETADVAVDQKKELPGSGLKKLLSQFKDIKDKRYDYDTEQIKKSSTLSDKRKLSSRTDRQKLVERDSPFQQPQILHGGKGLFIFAEKDEESQQVQSHIKNERTVAESPIWSAFYNYEDLGPITLPRNGFEEMILLTNNKQLWRFPIDNEQDVDESEARIPFYEHVILDGHLAEFPKIEPVQQFMHLILNGLSQNSFLSVKEKHEIIDWYKTYFTEKLDIINEALKAEKMEIDFKNELKSQKNSVQ